jgi:hypothetical protein
MNNYVKTPHLNLDFSKSKKKGANIAAAVKAIGNVNTGEGIIDIDSDELLKHGHMYGKHKCKKMKMKWDMDEGY